MNKRRLLAIGVLLSSLLVLTSCMDANGNLYGSLEAPVHVTIDNQTTVITTTPIIAIGTGNFTFTGYTGETGTAGTNGTNGANGTNGTNGVNATSGVYISCIAASTTLVVGNGTAYFTVPGMLAGLSLTVSGNITGAAVYTASSSGAITVQVYNVTTGHTMLTTAISVDQSTLTSCVSASPPVVNATYQVVSLGDQLRIDVTGAGTGTKGLDVWLGFR